MNTNSTEAGPVVHLYRVSGNMDQLIKHDLVGERTWKIRNEKITNSVYVELPLHEAMELYTQMKNRGMVAFKTWL